MTREEASNILDDFDVNFEGHTAKEVAEAFDVAFRALEQKPCDDCISRREAIKMFTYNYKGERISDYDCDNFPVQIAVKTVKEMLRKLPPVTPKEKTGEWLRMSDLSEQKDDRYKCSYCGNVVHYRDKMNLYTFNRWCGRCGSNNGARMVEPQESEKINCKSTKCENCINHNYCDFEPQESEDKE